MTSSVGGPALADLTLALQSAGRRELGYEEFLQLARRFELSPIWLRSQIDSVDADWDDIRIALLGECLYLPQLLGKPGWQGATSALCRLMCDPRMEAGTVELVADAVTHFPLTRPDLDALLAACTLPRWTAEGHWPDMRKALEAMLGVYHCGACSKADLVAALKDVVSSANTQSEDCGLRETALAMISKLGESGYPAESARASLKDLSA